MGVVGELNKDLAAVARLRTAGGLVEGPSWGLARNTTTLTSLVRRWAQLADDEPPTLADLDSFLALAIGSLGNQMTDFGVSFRFAAERLFGEVGVNLKGATLHKSYDRAAAVVFAAAVGSKGSSLTQHERNKLTASVRAKMANAMIELADGTTTNSNPSLEIDRFTLIREALAMLKGSNQPLILWGNDGNGKTELAKVVAARVSPGGNIAYVRGAGGWSNSQGPDLDRDLDQALKLAGRSLRPPGRATYQSFRELLRSPSNIDVVVLDDVDRQMMAALVDEAVIPIVATLKPENRWPSVTVKLLHVPEFSHDEAVSLVRKALPDETRGDVNDLVDRLGHQPHALRLICTELSSGVSTFPELLESVRRDAIAAIQQSAELTGQVADDFSHGAYERLVASIKDAFTLKVLDTLIWIKDTGKVRNIAWAVNGGLAITGESGVRQHHAAIRHLERLGLLEIDDSVVTMNSLTRRILQKIRWQSVPSLLSDYSRRMIWPLQGDTSSWRQSAPKALDLLRPQTFQGEVLELLTLNHLTRRFAPTLRVGAVISSSRGAIMWEWDGELSGPTSMDQLRISALDVRFGAVAGETQCWEWADTGWIRMQPEREERALCLLSLALIIGSGRAFGTRLETLSSLFGSRGPLPSLWTETDTDVRHILLPNFPGKVPDKSYSLAAWTRCGLSIVIPEMRFDDVSHEPVDLLPRCEDCSAYNWTNDEALEWYQVLRHLDDLQSWAGGSCDWKTEAMLLASLSIFEHTTNDGSLTVDPGQFLDRALVATDRAERSEAMTALFVRIWLLKNKLSLALLSQDKSNARVVLDQIFAILSADRLSPTWMLPYWVSLWRDLKEAGLTAEAARVDAEVRAL